MNAVSDAAPGPARPPGLKATEPEACPRVVVCDDSATVRASISALLGARYECLLLESGEEVLRASASHAPDLIISDVIMPGMSGHELCRLAKSMPRLRNVPFMLLTAVTNLEARAQALEVGADDYLFKPICDRELLARVSSLVRLRRTMLALEERTQALERANRDLREAQNALVHMENLAAVGTLAGGVAHEINGPLAVIKSGVSSMRVLLDGVDRAPDGMQRGEVLAELREILSDVDESSGRLQRIARDLKSAALSRHDELEPVDLPVEVDRAWDLAVVRTRSSGRIVRRFEPCGPILASRQLIGQALLNVLVNALQACGDGGTVEVSVRQDDRGVEIAIHDDGPGIAAEQLPRVFDPFFTTRAPGQGMGLGLTTAQAIVVGLGGRLEADSAPGRGATFRVCLPQRAACPRLS